MPKALIFDFDQTLSPHTMIDPILSHWGYDAKDFWASCQALQRNDGFDMELSYLYRLVEEGRRDPGRRLNAEKLKQWGREVKLFDGLLDGPAGEGLIKSLRRAGPCDIFVISGGLKPLIEGCLEALGLRADFSEIFACQMAEEDPGDGLGSRLSFPKETVGFTAKTQKLFAISKGSWKPGGPHVNEKIKDKSFNVPFRDMLYLGDGLSDIAAFATLKRFGGTCFAVHAPGDEKAAERARGIAEDGRAHAFFEADYGPQSPLRRAILDWLVKSD